VRQQLGVDSRRATQALLGLTPGDAESISTLVLTPTRELALQVSTHFKALMAESRLRVVAIVGGMSAQKQQRQLKQRPEVVVATPGRFWELLSMGEGWLSLKALRFFVLDEADRMIEAGHFEELNEIVAALPKSKVRQTFLFTATLHADGEDSAGRERKTLQSLTRRVPFRGKPEVVDLTISSGNADAAAGGGDGVDDEPATTVVTRLPAGLKESYIACPNDRKQEYLYYFLCRYPGRTIVFVNAISSIRRLQSLLGLLQLPVFGLHSNMQQRQRIKTVERFAAMENVVLVATDVAARGIDVKGVDHVVHFQITKSTDTYVHRCGRTARAGGTGMSLALVAEAEFHLWARARRELGDGGGQRKEPKEFPIERSYLPPLRKRLSLAQQADKIQSKDSKAKANSTWLKQAAADLDIELSDAEEDNGDGEEVGKGGRRKPARGRKGLAAIECELAELLQQPVLPTGFTYRAFSEDPALAERVLEAKKAGQAGGTSNTMLTKDDSAGALSELKYKKARPNKRDKRRKGKGGENAKQKPAASKTSAAAGRMVGGVFYPVGMPALAA
jgi:ATP-dependent RNA helicase DDX24/MAK5